MSEPASVTRDAETLSMIRRQDRACDEFEAAWISGQRPSIEDHLGEPGAPGYSALLRGLLDVDLAYRIRSGDVPSQEEYRGRFPEGHREIAGAFAAIGPPGADAEERSSPPSIPGYEILGELGRGGMGVVYKARDEDLNRVVALKMLLDGDLASREAKVRFQAEAEAVARFKNEHIVPIFRVGEYRGLPFLEMEFIEGGSLAARLGGGPMPPREAASLMESLATAVHHAHLRDIIHRDLKPANILLTAEGKPKIADFGLAKSLEGGEGLTMTGSFLGSPNYMAPEQAGMRGFPVGRATDVHALGAILYEMLTGRPPFRAGTVLDTLELVKSAEPTAPSRLRPGIPIDVETIALKCLQKDPGRRYASAEALADDLRRFSSGRPILARPVGSVERSILWARRRPVIAALSALCIVAFAALLVGSFWTLRRERRFALEGQAAEHRRVDAVNAGAEKTRQFLYASEVRLAFEDYDKGQSESARRLLDAQRPGPGQADLREFEWDYLWDLCDRDVVLRGHEAGIRSVAFSPDGRTLASASVDHTVRLWDVATWTQRAILRGHARSVSVVDFAPDGRSLYSGGDDGVILKWNAATGAEEARFPYPWSSIRALAASTDGKSLAFAADNHPDHAIVFVDVKSKTHQLLPRSHRSIITSLAFSANGATLASTGDDGTLGLWDPTKLERRAMVNSSIVGACSVAFGPSGTTVAVGGLDGSISLHDASTGAEKGRIKFPTRNTCFTITFASDERSLFSASLYHVDFPSGRVRREMTGHTGVVGASAIAPGGAILATGSDDSTIRLWDAHSGLPLLGSGGIAARFPSITSYDSTPDCLAFSPDGRSLAVAGDKGFLELRDAATGTTRSRVKLDERICSVVFTPDSKSLFAAGERHAIYRWDFASANSPPRLLAYPVPGESPEYGGHWSIALTRDGGHLAEGMGWRSNPGHLIIRKLLSERIIRDIRIDDYIRSVAFSPDGKTCAAGGGDETIRLWDYQTGHELPNLPGHVGQVLCVAFSPDGSTLASGAQDATVRLWDLVTYSERAVLRGTTASVQTLAFSPDGRRLATGSREGALLIWDVSTLRIVARLFGHAWRINAVAFSPDGEALASVGYDKTLRFWHAPKNRGVPKAAIRPASR